MEPPRTSRRSKTWAFGPTCHSPTGSGIAPISALLASVRRRERPLCLPQWSGAPPRLHLRGRTAYSIPSTSHDLSRVPSQGGLYTEWKDGALGLALLRRGVPGARASLPGDRAYQKAMRKRKVWVEPLFAEAKQWQAHAVSVCAGYGGSTPRRS